MACVYSWLRVDWQGSEKKVSFYAHIFSHNILHHEWIRDVNVQRDTQNTWLFFYVSLLWNNRDSLVVLAFSGYWEVLECDVILRTGGRVVEESANELSEEDL